MNIAGEVLGMARKADKQVEAGLIKAAIESERRQANRRADAQVGIGGAPTRATIIPTEASERKKYPMGTGLLYYFPDALAVVSNVSWAGNEQHNPGEPLHWARGKSGDQDDTILRHLVQSGTKDTDGIRHTAKAAWRILAKLQLELEAEMERGE